MVLIGCECDNDIYCSFGNEILLTKIDFFEPLYSDISPLYVHMSYSSRPLIPLSYSSIR